MDDIIWIKNGGFSVCIQAKSRRQRGNRSGWSRGDAQRTPAVSSRCEEARGPRQPPVVERGIGKGRATRRGLRPAHKGRSWQSASGAQSSHGSLRQAHSSRVWLVGAGWGKAASWWPEASSHRWPSRRPPRQLPTNGPPWRPCLPAGGPPGDHAPNSQGASHRHPSWRPQLPVGNPPTHPRPFPPAPPL
jgi:hypothetical protein